MDLFDVFEPNDNQKRRHNELETDKECDDFLNSVIDDVKNEAKKLKSVDEDVVVIDSDVIVDEQNENNVIEDEKFETLTPRVAIHELETREACLHEVVTPLDLEYVALRESQLNDDYKPAKEYQFVLDPFQKEAILCIENNQSVLGIHQFFVSFIFLM
jgi:ATP-dependent RNA helicase DOB1